ncbi:MAG: radical SAM protein [Rhodospirillales bacterium]|nr:radical SAM protein [Rhodospirillales bacterium]
MLKSLDLESQESVILEGKELLLDGTKIGWHEDRIKMWERGERFAPITIDMALTRACNYGCHFCYAMLQENARRNITKEVIDDFLEDCAELGVRGISLVGDGESSISPVFVHAIQKGAELGISMAVASNGLTLNSARAMEILPYLTYLRINFSAGEREEYAKIMGAKEVWFDRVCQNIKDMVEIKKTNNLDVTIGMQMVVMPEYEDQVLPLARLGKELRPDYLVLKHCSDDEEGTLGVDYSGYERFYDKLREAETLSDDGYEVVVKWSKIEAKGTRSYKRCYGSPFLLQISGTGLIAPCGLLFNNRYKKFHVGNICDTRFKDIVMSDEYWEIMNYLASPEFDAQVSCPTLCLQHKVNEALDDHAKGIKDIYETKTENIPNHINFI